MVLLMTSAFMTVSGVPAPEKMPAPPVVPEVRLPLNTRRLEMVTPAAMFALTEIMRCPPNAPNFVLLGPAPCSTMARVMTN